jgi:hypothetical protein
VLAALILGLLALAGLGCGARHLGPHTGQAYYRLFGMQLKPHLSTNEEPQLMSAEDAEVVMANMRDQTRRAQANQARATQMLLPISR